MRHVTLVLLPPRVYIWYRCPPQADLYTTTARDAAEHTGREG